MQTTFKKPHTNYHFYDKISIYNNTFAFCKVQICRQIILVVQNRILTDDSPKS